MFGLHKDFLTFLADYLISKKQIKFDMMSLIEEIEFPLAIYYDMMGFKNDRVLCKSFKMIPKPTE